MMALFAPSMISSNRERKIVEHWDNKAVSCLRGRRLDQSREVLMERTKQMIEYKMFVHTEKDVLRDVNYRLRIGNLYSRGLLGQVRPCSR